MNPTNHSPPPPKKKNKTLDKALSPNKVRKVVCFLLRLLQIDTKDSVIAKWGDHRFQDRSSPPRLEHDSQPGILQPLDK